MVERQKANDESQHVFERQFKKNQEEFWSKQNGCKAIFSNKGKTDTMMHSDEIELCSD